tara:strand:+ start:6878 stop:7795 length:918 start_codon:yes stop_codon:yes gene_type:complete
MKLSRDNIFKKYKWLREKKRPFIISSDYDGIICASFLSHYLNWELAGYYDYNSIWLSKEAIKNKNKLIWVDLNILPKTGKSIGGHIVSFDDKIPKGFKSSCNPNILQKINSNSFNKKFPFSTLIFLLWLHNKQIKNHERAKLLTLNSDNAWMKIQRYNKNTEEWIKALPEYEWDKLLKDVDSLSFEKQVDQFLYPKLQSIDAFTSFSKLKSKYLGIRSRECKINPDWDMDIILKLFYLIADYLEWTPPTIPDIITRVNGKQFKVPIAKVQKEGLDKFLNKNKIFSYAITSSKTFSYTVFNKLTQK